MKKRYSLAALALATVLFTSACQSNNASSNNSSSNSKTSTSQVSKKTTTFTTKESKKETNPNKSQAPKGSRLAQMNRKIKQVFPDILLPQVDGLGAGSDKLNVRTSSSNNENDVYYSVGNTALSFNNPAIQHELPFAVLAEKGNLTDQQASDVINFQAKEAGLPEISLDENTKATQQGGAGQSYVNWTEGNWSFTVHASTVAGQDPVPTAKQVLALSKKYKLPDPQTKGSLRIQVGYTYGSLGNVITWKQNNKVYQIRAHSLETAFKMVSSMK